MSSCSYAALPPTSPLERVICHFLCGVSCDSGRLSRSSLSCWLSLKYFFQRWGIEPRTLCMLGKCATTELCSQPLPLLLYTALIPPERRQVQDKAGRWMPPVCSLFKFLGRVTEAGIGKSHTAIFKPWLPCRVLGLWM